MKVNKLYTITEILEEELAAEIEKAIKIGFVIAELSTVIDYEYVKREIYSESGEPAYEYVLDNEGNPVIDMSVKGKLLYYNMRIYKEE